MMGMALVSISGAVLFVDFGGATGGHSSPWLLILGHLRKICGALTSGGDVGEIFVETWGFRRVNHHQITYILGIIG